MKVLVLDNYDSFTYNLVHYIEPHVEQLEVCFNDSIPWNRVHEFDKIVLSPGPGLPAEAGDLLLFLQRFATQKPILGVCLGLQAIVEHFGGELMNLNRVLHGKQSDLQVLNSLCALFQNIPKQSKIAHYHSWVANPNKLPEDLEVTALNSEGLVMAVQHKQLPIQAVQFHPESVYTEFGRQMIENWVHPK